MNVPCFSKGDIFIECNIPTNFNLPLTMNLYSKFFRIFTISRKHTFSSRDLQLVSFILLHMKLYGVSQRYKYDKHQA